jgi:RNase P/RNase MRP subunit POP5
LLKRVKRRYLAVRVDCGVKCSSGEFMDAVWGSVSRLFGDYGCSRVGLSLIGFDGLGQVAVLRVGLAGVESVRAALACVTEIGGRSAAVHVFRVSGTLKSLKVSRMRD